jgi:hypothetical protein
MKKLVSQTLLIMMVLLLSSCANKKKEAQQDLETKSMDNLEKENETVSELTLDSGKHWIANKETTDGVNNMIKLVNSFSEKENIEAYSKLTENLQSEFTMIFEKCTMKGEAHNQLHNFLIPIKDLFADLSSNDIEKCKESYEKLNKHLPVYQNYFK